MGSSVANMSHAKTFKEVNRLNAMVSVAHAAIDAAVQIKPRTRLQKGKASGNELVKKITKVASMLKKKTDEYENLVKEVDLEKNETEDMLKQTAVSVNATVEEAVRRVRAGAKEQLAMETSQMDDHIRHISRQLRVAEDKLQVLDAKASCTFVTTVAAVEATIEETVRVCDKG
jgi:hypothetical protein